LWRIEDRLRRPFLNDEAAIHEDDVRADFARDQKLVADRFISAARLDATRSAVAQNQARVDELHAQLRVAQTGARSDEIHAAERDVESTRRRSPRRLPPPSPTSSTAKANTCRREARS